MTKILVEFSGDDARLRAAHERLLAEQQKLLDKYKSLGDTTKKLSDEDLAALKKKADEEKAYQKLVEKASKIIQGNATAQEDYTAKVKEAKDMRDKQLLTDEQYHRELAKLKQELKDNIGVTERLKQAQKDEEVAVAKATLTTQKYLTTIERLQVELADVKRQYDQGKVSIETVQRAQKKLNDEQQKGKDPTLFESLKKGAMDYAIGLGSVTTAMALIRAGWTEIKKQQDEGLQALKGTSSADSKLLQVSSSPQEFRQLTTQADTLAVQTGVDRTVTREVLFQAVSEGFRDVVPEIIGANQVLPPQAAAGVAGQVPALFQGQIQAMEAVSMTLKAAELSRLDFEPLAKSLPQAAEGGAIAKATPEETMATLSVLASRFKSGDTAADRIKAFATKVGIDTGSVDTEYEDKLKREKERAANAAKDLRSKEEHVADLEKKLAGRNLTRESRPQVETQLERAKRAVTEFDREKLTVEEPKRTKPTRKSLQGMGIIKAVEELNTMTEEQRSEFLGDSQELNTAYTVLKEELGKIKSQESELKKERAARAAGGGTLREKVAIAANDPKLLAIKSEAIAQQKLQVTQAEVSGITGATGVGAEARAKEELLKNDGIVTQAIGSQVAPIASRAAAQAGFSREDSAAIGTGVTRAMTEVSGAGAATNPLAGIAELLKFAFTDNARKLNEAADKQVEAAKAFEAAAKANEASAKDVNAAANKLNQRVTPTVENIRAQAARAGQ